MRLLVSYVFFFCSFQKSKPLVNYWFERTLEGLLLARLLKEGTEKVTIASLLQAAALSGSFLCLLSLFTRERVYELFETDLV